MLVEMKPRRGIVDDCPAGGVVDLTAGTFRISGDGVEVRTSGITLRGAGPGQPGSGEGGTRLVKADRDTNASGAILYVGNNAAEFAELWRPLIPLDELFDDVVDSCEVGMRKPDPRIYELALDRLGVGAHEAVFVDDAPGNVRAAVAVGLAGVLFGPRREDVPAALAELDRLLA